MNRRKFLSVTAIATAIPSAYTLSGNITAPLNIEDNKPSDQMTIGVITSIKNPDEDIKKVRDFGFDHFQSSVEEFTPEMTKQIIQACKKYKVSPVALICMGPGNYIWNAVDGPSTIGLIPRQFRTERIQHLKDGIDFSKAAGFPAVLAHFGFIPENPKDELYLEFVEIMKGIGEYALKQGIDIYFETGQETPVTLLRTIMDIGTSNLFVNLDVGNLMLYGKANPVDGLRILEKYVKSLHAKDADYPTDPHKLGKEYPIPEGKVDFPKIISRLKSNHFKGCIVIENELSTNGKAYLQKTKKYLEGLIDKA
jgi:L-ribulose-5-phosphate 3-epimerase